MEHGMRLFIGIVFTPEIKRNILYFQSELKQMGLAGYWKAEENFHLTIEFLGEMQPQVVPVISSILKQAAVNKQPFTLGLEGLGGFPSLNRPHTLWTAVSGDRAELLRLRDDIHRSLLHQGFKLEERPFKPHLTLASRPVLGYTDLTALQTRKLGVFEVKDVILFESRVIRGKRTYTGLSGASLGR
jgi:2'-5' RNA ligase